MIIRKLVRWTAFFLVIIGCLLGIAQVQTRMIGIARHEELTLDDPLKNAPPAVAFVTIALGGFRGLLADLLFLRSEAMKEDGNYFELVQLADWLVDLQPRFTGATAFLAWNMAYNVSVTFSDPRDRWRWVQRGIELIRDKALLANPADPLLFHQLGWIYQHKVGHILDDANRYYKSQLALQLRQVLGAQRQFDWEHLAAAPLDEAELRALLDDEEERLLDQALASRHLTLDQFEDQFRTGKNAGRWPAEIRQELDQAKSGRVSVYVTMDFYLRSRWLRDRYKLDARIIQPIIKQYGYLDFRLPEAHAVYWAKRGMEHAQGGLSLECERMVNQSLMNALKGGSLVYLPQNGPPIIGPNLAVAEAVRDQYLEAYKKFPDNESFMAGYENFMKDCIGLLYTGGQTKRASVFLKQLSEKFPNKPDYRLPIDEFGIMMIDKSIGDKSLKQTEGVIDGFLLTACRNQAYGDDDAARAAEYIACTMTNRYNKDRDTNRAFERTGLMDCRQRMKIIREIVGDPKNGALPPELIPDFRAAVGLPPLTATGEAPTTNVAAGGVAPGLNDRPDNGVTPLDQNPVGTIKGDGTVLQLPAPTAK